MAGGVTPDADLEPDAIGWELAGDRIRAVRSQPVGLAWRSYLVSGYCWHAEPLTVPCDLCAADINYLGESDGAKADLAG